MIQPWAATPPEFNHELLALAPGPAQTLAAAEALMGHHAAMTATVGVSSAIGAVAAESHVGFGGAASAAALMSHDDEHLTFAEETLVRAQLLNAAAAAHPMYMAQMVPAPVAHANRLEEAADEVINPLVWGALTPRIVELNTEYFGFMWPNNAAAGLRYGATLDALGAALMAPSMPAISGGSIAAAAVAAATVAESAALSGMQAAVGTVGSGVSAVAGPAAALPASAMSAVSSSGSSVATASPTAPVQPLAAVTHTAPPTPAQTMTPAQSSTGMYAPSPNANLMTPPPVPQTTAQPPITQPMMPRPPLSPPMPAAAPGVTSFVPPAQPFSPPPPPAGRAAGLKPGMLNAIALRGPVSTMPLVTSGASSTLATAAQPLAFVSPTPPPSQPALPSQAQLQTGTINTLQPPPTPPQTRPVQLPTPPAVPQSSPPAPSTGPTGPSANGTGIQMLGNGPPGAPQAPPLPMPLDPSPPVPPPPSPGHSPLQRPDISAWTAPPRAQEAQIALKNLQDLEDAINYHNEHPPNPYDPDAVAAYNSQANYYNHWAAQLEGTVESYNAEYSPASIAQTVDAPNTPSWAHQEPPLPQGPIGQRGVPLNVPKGTNSPATIDGVNFSGHAIDEMQSDGIPLSVVNRALHVGAIEPGKFGRTIFFDATNNVSVIQDLDGTIVTVSFGHLHA